MSSKAIDISVGESRSDKGKESIDDLSMILGAVRERQRLHSLGSHACLSELKDEVPPTTLKPGSNVERSVSVVGAVPVGGLGGVEGARETLAEDFSTRENDRSTYLAEATLVKEDDEEQVRNVTSSEAAELVVMAKPVRKGTRSRYVAAASVAVLVLVGVILLGVLVPKGESNDPRVVASAPPVVDENEVIAVVPESICYSHIPLETDLSRVCVDPASLPKGGPLCQLVATGILHQIDADMALTNGGAQRGDILPGNFTVGHAVNILPFVSNRVSLVSLNGSLIWETLEDSIAKSISVVPLKVSISAAYPYAAGLRFDVNLTAPYGSRVSNVQVNPNLSTAWSPIDPEATYRVATNSYLAGGGDGYFANVPKDQVVDTDIGFTDAFIDYCRDVGVLDNPTLEEMSTQDFSGLSS